jgi:hypothetical protein
MIVWLGGETTIAATVALVTTSEAFCDRPLAGSLAVTVAVPGMTPLARPELLIVATVPFAETAVHWTELVKLLWWPSV